MKTLSYRILVLVVVELLENYAEIPKTGIPSDANSVEVSMVPDI